MKVYVVGQTRPEKPEGADYWELQGVFTTLDGARAACRNDRYFVWEEDLDVALPDETDIHPFTWEPVRPVSADDGGIRHGGRDASVSNDQQGAMMPSQTAEVVYRMEENVMGDCWEPCLRDLSDDPTQQLQIAGEMAARTRRSHRVRKITISAETVFSVIVTPQMTAYTGDPPVDEPKEQ